MVTDMPRPGHWAFVAINHHTAEARASVAGRGDPFAALERIYRAV